MDYNATFEEVKHAGLEIQKAKQLVEKLGTILEELMKSRPKNDVEFDFHNWSYEYVVNFLLHFIEAKGLTAELKEIIEILNSIDGD